MGVLPSKEASILAQEGKMTESWYEPMGPECRQRMEKKTYGKEHQQGFLEATHKDCCGRDIFKFEQDTHEMGKKYGGRIFVVEKASMDIHNDIYGTVPEKPTFKLTGDSTLTARVVFTVPPCFIPVGEQTLTPDNEELFELASIFGNKSKVLVGEVPKVFALFVSVDGEPKALERVSEECIDYMHKQYLKDFIHRDSIPGCLVSWQPVENSWETLFQDIPMLGKLESVEETRDTGLHGKACTAAFIELFTGLTPGEHNIDMELFYYFDHTRFTRMKISSFDGENSFWDEGFYESERRFKERHPRHGQFERCPVPIAKGSFSILIDEKDNEAVSEMIDKKVPLEMYQGEDREEMRTVARDAYHKFHYFLPDDLPEADHIALTTSRKDYSYIKQEGIHDLRKTYQFVEVALLWLNGKDPNEMGKMLDLVMIRTDDADSPPGGAASWIMSKRRCVIDLVIERVKNKYILRAMNESKSKI